MCEWAFSCERRPFFHRTDEPAYGQSIIVARLDPWMQRLRPSSVRRHLVSVAHRCELGLKRVVVLMLFVATPIKIAVLMSCI
jgi:hypothetical protein